MKGTQMALSQEHKLYFTHHGWYQIQTHLYYFKVLIKVLKPNKFRPYTGQMFLDKRIFLWEILQILMMFNRVILGLVILIRVLLQLQNFLKGLRIFLLTNKIIRLASMELNFTLEVNHGL